MSNNNLLTLWLCFLQVHTFIWFCLCFGALNVTLVSVFKFMFAYFYFLNLSQQVVLSKVSLVMLFDVAFFKLFSYGLHTSTLV